MAPHVPSRPVEPKGKLLDPMRHIIRLKHLSDRTEEAIRCLPSAFANWLSRLCAAAPRRAVRGDRRATLGCPRGDRGCAPEVYPLEPFGMMQYYTDYWGAYTRRTREEPIFPPPCVARDVTPVDVEELVDIRSTGMDEHLLWA